MSPRGPVGRLLARLGPPGAGHPAVETLAERSLPVLAFRAGRTTARVVRLLVPGLAPGRLASAFADGVAQGAEPDDAEGDVVPFPRR